MYTSTCVHVCTCMRVCVWVYGYTQARRKVFAIGAANSGEGGGFVKGVNFTIITCADPVPAKKYITDIGRYVLGLF